MNVDFGHGRNVVRLSADTTDNAKVIHSLKFSISKKSVPKGEEALCSVPS
ncbi:unknown [Bacteroides sp. CAG:462]|nr:unknown [Bacteroides sp. CAG:462]